MWQQTRGYSVCQRQQIDSGSVGGSGRRKLGKLGRRKRCDPSRGRARCATVCHRVPPVSHLLGR